MGQVLYEASFQLEFFNLLPVLTVIAFAMFPFIFKRGSKKFEKKLEETCNIESLNLVITIISIGFSVFAAIGAIMALIGSVDMYNKTVKAYQQGNYEIVEGYVENFDPMPYTGHRFETFDINGVSFSYSDFHHIQGYHNAQSHGGVITGDGQHLKIGYVYYNEAEGNVIVYIEELD